MPNKLVLAILCFLTAFAATVDSGQAKRLALVVGNSAYSATTPLPNAVNDARLIADFFRTNNFEVDLVVDATRADFARGLAAFTAKLEPKDTAVFYYAGHGMQLYGENFLLGVDAKLDTEFDVAAETVALNTIVGSIQGRAALALIFLDACRDNPIADRLNARIAAMGSSTVGLAPMASASAGTMIAFSASPGQVSYDGAGSNSSFAVALTQHFSTPGEEITLAFKKVVRSVREQTGGKQSPQLVSNLAGPVYLQGDQEYVDPTENAASADPLVRAFEAELDRWDTCIIENSARQHAENSIRKRKSNFEKMFAKSEAACASILAKVEKKHPGNATFQGMADAYRYNAASFIKEQLSYEQ